MKPTLLKSLRRGFTLVELTLVLSFGMIIATIAMTLFNQQLSFLKIFQTQQFLTDEAPIINMYVSKLVGQADRFRLHSNVHDALQGINPRNEPSPVIVLNFRQPNGTIRPAILAFEDNGSGPQLNYYVVSSSGTAETPSWYITNTATDVSFNVENGILRMTITGPNQEVVTYSGSMTQ